MDENLIWSIEILRERKRDRQTGTERDTERREGGEKKEGRNEEEERENEHKSPWPVVGTVLKSLQILSSLIQQTPNETIANIYRDL